MCVANCIPSLSQNTYINFTSLVNSTRVFGRITDSLIQIQAMEKNIEEIGAKENRKIDDDEEDQDEAGNVLDNESQDMAGKNHHHSTYEKTYVPGRGIERYNNSFKNLLPIRRKTKYEETISMDSSGLFSSLGISWFSKFMYKAYSGGLKMEELPKLSPYDTCDYNTDRLELLWKAELAKKGSKMASFSKVAWRFCRTRIIISCFIMMCSFASTFLTYTVFMRKLLEYIQSGGGSYGEGLKWALLLFAVGTIRVLLVISTWALNQRTGLRLRSACLTLLYRKIIRVNNLGNKNIGEMINVFSNDAQRIFEMTYFGPPIIEAPVITVYTVLYVLWIFQPMGLLGIVVFLLFYPLVYAVSRLIGYLLTKAMNVSDVRVRLMNEILDCIKLIKMYAWEKRFRKDLLDTREKERRILLNATYCSIANASMTLIAPVISTIITILAHVSGGYNLTAAQVFPYVSFLESRFRVSLNIFQRGLDSIVLAGISFERIKNLLLLEETECSILKPILKSQAVAINNGTFAYNNSSYDKEQSCQANGTKRTNASTGPADKSEQEKLNKPTENAEHVQVLFDVSFKAEKGKLIGICGTVGSGKSSLLLAVLGQLRVSEGQVMRDGSCAYVSQQAWISNATLRENILFGAKFDRSRYDKTIYACNLSQDIDMMPGGDQTEIGEKGVNLSGGQKQRVALARALYADRDIYLLDDPLSAVDSRVGSYIFDNLILGALREKTVLFVTHQIQYLNRCDDIYMMQNGRIIEHGTHDELMKLENEYAMMVAAISSDYKTEDETFADQKIESLPRLQVNLIPLNEEGANTTSRYNVEKSDTPDTQLIVAEYLQQGNIKADAYHAYIVAAGGYFFCFIVFLTFVANSASTALSSWWLAKWIKAGGGNATILRNNETILSDNVNDNPDFFYYQTIYASSIGIIVLSAVLYTFVFTRATIAASTRLHNDLFRKVISSPMRFFDTTPSGRIQHLFSRDMDEVDKKLPGTVNNCIESVLRIFLSALVVCTVFPWFLLPMVLILVVYYFISTRFGAAIRDLKRMDNKMRAPVISFVTATVQGLSTIHAFGVEDDFRAKFVDLFGENGKFLFMYSISILWLMLRIDCLSVAMIGFTAISVVVFQDQVPPALAGLALAYASQVTGVMAYSITLISETEVRFTSVERINHYIKILQGESGENKSTVEPQPTWPKAAEIKFKNVCMAYGDGAPLILKNVSFTVHPGEKIGIVGRTGSGKSSLTVALFRLVELAEGKIEIDDVDISEISLNQLRTKLSIIPQDPVLFSGTIRSNLDPFKLYTDVEIWEALEKTELKNRVRLIPGQLDASVGSGGDNMSVGERQLLCLSRALLRNSKILILDEATAAVDRETEIAVQNTVQREFASCTILTIAHRLQTVSSLSRVLVINDGKVLEFETPSNLLGDPSSEFSKMMAAAKQAEIQ